MVGKGKRGRPRKEAGRLARWEPPEGWVRVVAWVSPEERKMLKQAAVAEDSSVAELIRGLAHSLDEEVVLAEELLAQTRRGKETMKKIPTLFERGENFKVIDRPREGCEWVFAGDGAATEKLDGTNIRLTLRAGQVVHVEKRRNPSKRQKKEGIVDGWYVDADPYAAEDRWIFEAVKGTETDHWPDGEHSCEALGPKIQGNPLGLEQHICVPFDLEIPVYEEVPRDYEGLRSFLRELESHYAPGTLAEGIVFHHPDGRRAKIKGKDFPQ